MPKLTDDDFKSLTNFLTAVILLIAVVGFGVALFYTFVDNRFWSCVCIDVCASMGRPGVRYCHKDHVVCSDNFVVDMQRK